MRRTWRKIDAHDRQATCGSSEIMRKRNSAFTLEMLEKAGFEEAVLAVGYGSEQVERLLDEKYSGKIKLHMINTAGKSTVQAVRTAMCDETEILAVECNCICTHPLDEIIKVHLSYDTFCTALTYDTENKPAGIYIVKRELLIVLILKSLWI